jgi:hypothetical protein
MKTHFEAVFNFCFQVFSLAVSVIPPNLAPFFILFPPFSVNPFEQRPSMNVFDESGDFSHH